LKSRAFRAAAIIAGAAKDVFAAPVDAASIEGSPDHQTRLVFKSG
jgi:hypothetical protein